MNMKRHIVTKAEVTNKEFRYSFLISLYIKESTDHLEQCFQSLSEQTVQPTQTVVVLDGPVLNTHLEVIDKWTSCLNITKIPLRENIGLGRALQTGLQYCTEDVVARADTDDLYEPTRMEKQLSYLSAHPECMIVGANIAEFHQYPGDIQRVRVTPKCTEQIRIYAKWRNPFNHISVVFRRDFIMKLGGYEDHLLMEDYNLWIRALSANVHVHNIQEVLAYARVGANGEMMASRRRGRIYVQSEYRLYRLILKHHINKNPQAFFAFLLRSSTRLLPPKLLSLLYLALRA